MKKIISTAVLLLAVLFAFPAVAKINWPQFFPGGKPTVNPTANPTLCEPYVCKDGQQFPSCAGNGAPINYYVEPCLNHGGRALTRPTPSVSPTGTPTPKPRKAEITACKEAFNTAKKVYASAKEKARTDFLAAMKKAIGDYQTAYKLAREQKSNEAKKAARTAYQTARKAIQDKYAADKKAAKNAWEAVRKVYNLCVEKPTPTPSQ